MTREEARRLRGDGPGEEENGPDPAEDPIAYLKDRREEDDE